MVRYLPVLLELALLLYALVDCIQTQNHRVRNLPKLAWIAVVVLVPIIGPLAWLFAGRPAREDSAGWPLRPGPSGERPRPLAPDDDPEFLNRLKKSNQEDRELFNKWEEDLRRREEQLRKDAEGDDPDAPRA